MKLLNPTDDELNAVFAEKVAGWGRSKASDIFIDDRGCLMPKLIFTLSIDAVLPWLNNYLRVDVIKAGEADAWNVAIFDGHSIIGEAKSALARAACIALLQAHGVEVAFSQ